VNALDLLDKSFKAAEHYICHLCIMETVMYV